jgi:hypothetical protein
LCLGAETIEALADTGYYNGTELKACEDDGIMAYVPEPDRAARCEAQGRFSHEDFAYDDAEADVTAVRPASCCGRSRAASATTQAGS